MTYLTFLAKAARSTTVCEEAKLENKQARRSVGWIVACTPVSILAPSQSAGHVLIAIVLLGVVRNRFQVEPLQEWLQLPVCSGTPYPLKGPEVETAQPQ